MCPGAHYRYCRHVPWGSLQILHADMCPGLTTDTADMCPGAHYRYCRHVARGSLQVLQMCAQGLTTGTADMWPGAHYRYCRRVPRGSLQVLQTCAQGLTTDTVDMCPGAHYRYKISCREWYNIVSSKLTLKSPISTKLEYKEGLRFCKKNK